ncbi:MAG: methylenetetrahydrofolate reductase [NAD(P)H] [Candidatus Lokiarchaeota archaeon]|nr:methylenetetrahydrofolate reductase [NAD(P)H] [Candidatus Harpocratesius repetitus]
MYISQLYSNKHLVLSFEIFPPKKNFPINKLVNQLETFSKLKPDYMSVTYGAGGSTRDRTIEIAGLIKENFGIEPLAHLTCISSTKDQIHRIVQDLENHNIQNVLALRGDLPTDPNFVFPTPLHFEFASDLIQFLKSEGKFCIGAAFYPEGHIEAPNQETDFRNVAYKVKQGTDFLISQMFFDNAFLLDSIQKLHILGVNLPFSAGIMPVTNIKQVKRIASLCGATFPPSLLQELSKRQDDPQMVEEFGINYAVKQIRALIQAGIDGIHIYTMNKPHIAQKIIEKIHDLI